MLDTLVSFEIAILAQRAGFRRPCFYYASYKRKFPTTAGFDLNSPEARDWNNPNESGFYYKVSLPFQSQLQKWLREVHDIHIVIIPTPEDHWTFKLIDLGVEDIERPPYSKVEAEDFNSYESCLEEALQKCLTTIITNNHDSRRI